MNAKTDNKAFKIALTALISALLVGGQWALTLVPNVEIVTIVLAVFAFACGLSYAVCSAIIFVIVQTLLLGFNTWVLSYLVYFPTVAIVFGLLSKVKFKRMASKAIVATATAVVLTFAFGLCTSVVDTLLAFSYKNGFWIVSEDFWWRFSAMYARGILFFAVHMASNGVLFAVGFVPLTEIVKRLMKN